MNEAASKNANHISIFVLRGKLSKCKYGHVMLTHTIV